VNKQEFSASSWRSNLGYTKIHGQPNIKSEEEALEGKRVKKKKIQSHHTQAHSRIKHSKI